VSAARRYFIYVGRTTSCLIGEGVPSIAGQVREMMIATALERSRLDGLVALTLEAEGGEPELVGTYLNGEELAK
jgi:hypothetical protein